MEGSGDKRYVEAETRLLGPDRIYFCAPGSVASVNIAASKPVLCHDAAETLQYGKR